MSIFGDRLRKLRTDKKLRQKDVAIELGLAPRAYQTYELGEREANYEIIVKIADYFNVSTDYLLGRSEDPLRK